MDFEFLFRLRDKARSLYVLSSSSIRIWFSKYFFLASQRLIAFIASPESPRPSLLPRVSEWRIPAIVRTTSLYSLVSVSIEGAPHCPGLYGSISGFLSLNAFPMVDAVCGRLWLAVWGLLIPPNEELLYDIRSSSSSYLCSYTTLLF